jgi:hypothetical protein
MLQYAHHSRGAGITRCGDGAEHLTDRTSPCGAPPRGMPHDCLMGFAEKSGDGCRCDAEIKKALPRQHDKEGHNTNSVSLPPVPAVVMSPGPISGAVVSPDHNRRGSIHHWRRGHDHGRGGIHDGWWWGSDHDRRRRDDHRQPDANGYPHSRMGRERQGQRCEADNGDNGQCAEKRFRVWHCVCPLGVVDRRVPFLSSLYAHRRYVDGRAVTPCLWA